MSREFGVASLPAAFSARRLEPGTRGAEQATFGDRHGLNYGLAVLGDVGSEHIFSFSVIGDTVNTPSRLQRLTLPRNLASRRRRSGLRQQVGIF